MTYHAIATDYDGTLATDSVVAAETWATLSDFRQGGGRVFLVTGREFEDLKRVCPALDRFDAVIAENGGVLYWPADDVIIPQGSAPPAEFVARLRRSGVDDIQQGRVIVSTWQPHEITVRSLIHDMQLDHHVILNKRAVMVLPLGVDKASALNTIFQTLQISPHAAIGIGDAENDLALLQHCGVGVAVANAVPELKAIADHVTVGARGAGVQEIIQAVMAADFNY